MKFGGTAAGVGGDRTHDAIARLVLEHGPQTVAALAERLQLSAPAVRRHVDALVAEGVLAERVPRVGPKRGRGRPARTFALTDAGRGNFPHGYDELATAALRYLRETGGEAAVTAFAEHHAASLTDLVRDDVDPAASAPSRAHALAGALSRNGYAATAEAAPAGVQLCQHHCPVAHVAAEFGELCEAETRAFERILGTNVQRLATIAHGDGVCTTYVPTALISPPKPTDPAPNSAGTDVRKDSR